MNGTTAENAATPCSTATSSTQHTSAHGGQQTLFSLRAATKSAVSAFSEYATGGIPESPASPDAAISIEMADAEPVLPRADKEPSGAFILPKGRKRAANSPPALQAKQPLKTANRFTPIQPQEEDNTAPLIPETDSGTMQQRPAIRRRPPAILIYSISDYRKSLALIKSAVKGEFTVSIRRNCTRLQVDSAEDHAAVTLLLAKEKAEASSWPLKEEKLTSFLIRGIEADFDLEFLRELFEAEGVPVTAIRTLRARNGDKRDLHQLTVRPTEEWPAKKIEKLRRVGPVNFSLKPYRHDRPQMCYNCNRFGHSSNFCTAAPRCWKCAGDHYGSRCTLSREEPATCCNCRGDHPAMSRKCPVYKRHLERMRQQQGPRQEPETQKPQATKVPPASMTSGLGRQNPWGTGIPGPSSRPRTTPRSRLDVEFPALPRQASTPSSGTATSLPTETTIPDPNLDNLDTTAILKQLLLISLQTQQQLQLQSNILTKMFEKLAATPVP